MATNHTENYALNLWEANDKFVREEFNENTSKLDAAIKAVDGKVPKIVRGWCWGDGEASQHIDLGFTPDAITVFASDPPSRTGGHLYGGVAVTASWPQMKSGSSTYNALKIEQEGFTLWETPSVGVHCNMKDVKYSYVAIKL